MKILSISNHFLLTLRVPINKLVLSPLPDKLNPLSFSLRNSEKIAFIGRFLVLGMFCDLHFYRNVDSMPAMVYLYNESLSLIPLAMVING
ncbi:hypothetical protein SGGMMB4_05774 (plasmid) [Sodalis glossinidius str. 'morsitans']|uniref:Uncharacterized protein n=1 Tax=Sodalis glossinidius (strain morsitans) TaxID=343509 RepID=A0A193QNZ5_SODGM|nr:hypothetical protein SGGMMB4_05774 [Sodalis glossinidius str. 'morsitans']